MNPPDPMSFLGQLGAALVAIAAIPAKLDQLLALQQETLDKVNTNSADLQALQDELTAAVTAIGDLKTVQDASKAAQDDAVAKMQTVDADVNALALKVGSSTGTPEDLSAAKALADKLVASLGDAKTAATDAQTKATAIDDSITALDASVKNALNSSGAPASSDTTGTPPPTTSQ